LVIWNWKAALLSALYRAPVFFFTSLRAGWRLAVSAMFAETIFRAVTSGFYGALTQTLRNLQPAWLAVGLIAVVTPLVLQAMEYGFHFALGTPNLQHGAIVSLIITAVGALFNLFAMRHGTFLTGSEGHSLGSDLKRLPLIIFEFIAAGPLAIYRVFRPLKRL
jgi:hypothetical protein